MSCFVLLSLEPHSDFHFQDVPYPKPPSWYSWVLLGTCRKEFVIFVLYFQVGVGFGRYVGMGSGV